MWHVGETNLLRRCYINMFYFGQKSKKWFRNAHIKMKTETCSVESVVGYIYIRSCTHWSSNWGKAVSKEIFQPLAKELIFFFSFGERSLLSRNVLLRSRLSHFCSRISCNKPVDTLGPRKPERFPIQKVLDCTRNWTQIPSVYCITSRLPLRSCTSEIVGDLLSFEWLLIFFEISLLLFLFHFIFKKYLMFCISDEIHVSFEKLSHMCFLHYLRIHVKYA